MVKVSIVMAYYNRKQQTIYTLDGFEKNYVGKYDFEVIIIDDCSKDEERLDNIISKYTFPIKYIYITQEEKGTRVNPAGAYNKGFEYITGEYTIIQNPECCHIGDIIGYTLSYLTENNYLCFSCFGPSSFELTSEILNADNMYNKILSFNNRKRYKHSYWYNHPVLRRVNLHWCSAITTINLKFQGGFDEAFNDGYAFDDDQLLLDIQHILKLDVLCIHPDECFVIHQYHVSSASNYDNNKWIQNQTLFENRKKYFIDNSLKYPRLLHLVWNQTNFTHLNYLSLTTFNKHNKLWRIVIHTPKNIDYDDLKNIKNLFIHITDDVNIYQKYNGIWSDFDILYTNPINFDFDEDMIIFESKSYLTKFSIVKPKKNNSIKIYNSEEYFSLNDTELLPNHIGVKLLDYPKYYFITFEGT